MVSNLRILVKKRTQPEWLIFFIVLLPFFYGIFFEMFSLSRVIRYTLDLAWIWLLFLAAINLFKGKVSFSNNTKIVEFWIASFILITFITYMFNYKSVIYYLWGFRNNFRFFFFFLSVILFLDISDGKKLLKLFDILFWINTPIMLFQYFVMGYNQDFLGGIFGVEVGCNSYTNIFFVIIVARSAVSFFNKKESIWLFFAKSAVALLLVTLAEIKFFYIEYLLIIAVSFLITDFSIRKLLGVVIAAVILIASLFVLYEIFPFYRGFFNIENMIKSQSFGGYSSSNTLNRLTAVPTVSNEFLETPFQKIFGLGLGNCDGSENFSLVNTSFYESYGYLKFLWFSAPFVTLETGFSGLTLYIGFFVLIFILLLHNAKKYEKEKSIFQMAAIVAIICPLIVIYNSSLRTEAAYMIFFVLALPFILINLKHRGKVYE